MFYGFYSTPPPPPNHHCSLHDAFVFSWIGIPASHLPNCDSQKSFIFPCHVCKDFFFFKSAFWSTFMNSVQRRNACVFIWRTTSVFLGVFSSPGTAVCTLYLTDMWTFPFFFQIDYKQGFLPKGHFSVLAHFSQFDLNLTHHFPYCWHSAVF